MNKRVVALWLHEGDMVLTGEDWRELTAGRIPWDHVPRLATQVAAYDQGTERRHTA